MFTAFFLLILDLRYRYICIKHIKKKSNYNYRKTCELDVSKIEKQIAYFTISRSLEPPFTQI